MQFKTRNEAVVDGSKFFFTGKPCRAGHTAERYVSTGNCVDCHKISMERYRQNMHDMRPGITVLSNLKVPTKHVDAILAVVNIYLKMENLEFPEKPTITALSSRRSLTPEEVRAIIKERRLDR